VRHHRGIFLDQRRERFFSASAALRPRNVLEIKGIAQKTPPAPSGSKAAQFSQFSVTVKRPRLQIVLSSPKSGGKINNF
jgi:hypothetical protein